MNKYTFKNTPLKDAFKKASQQSHYIKNLVQKAKQKGIARRYTTKDGLNDMARECVKRDMERQAKPVKSKRTVGRLIYDAKQKAIAERYACKVNHKDKLDDKTREQLKYDGPRYIKPITSNDTVRLINGMTYNLNPNGEGYETEKAIVKNRMLDRIAILMADRQALLTYVDSDTMLTCWTDFYLGYTDGKAEYDGMYSLVKKICDVAVSDYGVPYFDDTTGKLKRKIWDVLNSECGSELDCITSGWTISNVLRRAYEQNYREYEKQKDEHHESNTCVVSIDSDLAD